MFGSVVGWVSVWVKNGLTMHLRNISKLRSKNIDYVLLNISVCMQDPKLSVAWVVDWVGGRLLCGWVSGWMGLKID